LIQSFLIIRWFTGYDLKMRKESSKLFWCHNLLPHSFTENSSIFFRDLLQYDFKDKWKINEEYVYVFFSFVSCSKLLIFKASAGEESFCVVNVSHKLISIDATMHWRQRVRGRRWVWLSAFIFIAAASSSLRYENKRFSCCVHAREKERDREREGRHVFPRVAHIQRSRDTHRANLFTFFKFALRCRRQY